METTSSHDTTSDEETTMVYEGQMQEDTTSVESASGILERDQLSDMAEESTTEEIAKPAPLRRSSRIKRPAPHCHLCDPQIRVECDCREQDM